MLWLAGGVAVLCGVLLLIYTFVNASPAKLARLAQGVGLAVLAVVLLALIVVTEGRLLMFIAPLLALAPLLRRWSAWFSAVGTPATGASSDVETAFLRMRLDHDTGAMVGTVLRGRFAGMRLEELGRSDLIALLRECRAADEDGARLLEAYLDRLAPEWRDDLGTAGAGAASAANVDITVEEAYAILGLAPGADAGAIKAAHHRLMKQFHPDHGGTDYLATKINRARDVLLRATRDR